MLQDNFFRLSTATLNKMVEIYEQCEGGEEEANTNET